MNKVTSNQGLRYDDRRRHRGHHGGDEGDAGFLGQPQRAVRGEEEGVGRAPVDARGGGRGERLSRRSC